MRPQPQHRPCVHRRPEKQKEAVSKGGSQPVRPSAACRRRGQPASHGKEGTRRRGPAGVGGRGTRPRAGAQVSCGPAPPNHASILAPPGPSLRPRPSWSLGAGPLHLSTLTQAPLGAFSAEPHPNPVPAPPRFRMGESCFRLPNLWPLARGWGRGREAAPKKSRPCARSPASRGLCRKCSSGWPRRGRGRVAPGHRLGPSGHPTPPSPAARP